MHAILPIISCTALFLIYYSTYVSFEFFKHTKTLSSAKALLETGAHICRHANGAHVQAKIPCAH